MDFAKKQLEKYGWKEVEFCVSGQGLGRNEDGISTALKPKLKFDATGVGYSAGKDFTDDWWNSVYQSALNNIEVANKSKDEVAVNLKNKESIDITSKSYLKELKRQNVNLEYGSFLKTAKLTSKGTVNYGTSNLLETKLETKIPTLTDEELFAACGGRTAHKGARHGLKLSGKLSRLEKQEKMLLKKLQNVSLCDEKNDIERKIKKITKHKEKHKNNIEDVFGTLTFEDDSRSSSSSTSKKHKKKKKRKSVSFNETVTKYFTRDLDSSINSSDSNEASVVLTIVEKSQIKDEETAPSNNANVDLNGCDEGNLLLMCIVCYKFYNINFNNKFLNYCLN
ncbi:g patch domain containing protein [Holotrichia oblita]|uniref:G patch domain containing protein n=1 Tax=Holotrichia oblita TaxID=644536 RepID=A0ACB9TLK1_HOLOL|nr:g patch domain containing protein [Holotrichia oblita]